MYEQIKQLGVEHFGNEAQGEAFAVAFLTKAASFKPADAPFNAGTHGAGSIAENFTKGLGNELGKGLVTGVLGSAIGAAAGKIKDIALYRKFLDALRTVKGKNKVVSSADPAKVMSFAETIFKFAPHVAADANVLENILTNAVHFDSLDSMTIKTLTELEGRITQNSANR